MLGLHGSVASVQIFRRGSERVLDLSWENLKKEVTQAVESEVILSFPEVFVQSELYEIRSPS